MVKVDNTIFANGAPGPVGLRLRALYDEWMTRPEYAEPVIYG